MAVHAITASDSEIGNPSKSPRVAKATDTQETDALLGDSSGDCDDDDIDEDDHMKDWSGAPWHKTPSVYWLIPAFGLFALAFGGVVVPRLNIILDLICREYFWGQNSRGGQFILPIIGGDDNEQCQIPEVHARTSTFVLVMGLIAGLLSAFTSPRLGSLSDRYGRCYLLALSSLGILTSEIATVVAVKYPQYFSVNILFVGAVADGLCGSSLLGMALANSYSADCTSPKQRAMVFAAFQGFLFLGIAAGPVLGGLLVEWTGNILSIFYVAMGMHILFILYIVFVLPESLSKRRMEEARAKYIAESRLHGRGKHWADLRHFLQPLAILFPTGPGTTRRLRLNLMMLAAIDSIMFGVGMAGMTVIIMYAERKFHWRNIDSSVYLSVVNSIRVSVLFIILPLIITTFRRNQPKSQHHGSDRLDIALIRFAVVVEGLGYFCYAIAPTGAVFTLAGAFAAFGSFGSPIIQSTLTKHIPKDRTGQLLGAMALLQSMVRVVAPTAFNMIYAATVGTVPQTVFVCLGSAFVGAFVCSLFIKPGLYWEEQPAQEQT